MSTPVASLEQVFSAYPATLTVEQCAELLGQESTTTIYRWLNKGLIPGYKVGTSWVIYRDEVRKHLEDERAAREAAGKTVTD